MSSEYCRLRQIIEASNPLDVSKFAKLAGKQYSSHVEGGCADFAVAAIKVLREEGLDPEFIMIGWDHAGVRVGGFEFDGAGLLTPGRVQAYARKWNEFEKRELEEDDPHYVPLPARFLTSEEFIDHPGGGGGTFEIDGLTIPLIWSEVTNDSEIEEIVPKLKAIIASMSRNM